MMEPDPQKAWLAACVEADRRNVERPVRRDYVAGYRAGVAASPRMPKTDLNEEESANLQRLMDEPHHPAMAAVNVERAKAALMDHRFPRGWPPLETVPALPDGLTRCPVCGVYFLPQRSTAVYCSPNCRQKAFQAKVKARPNG